MNHRSIAGLHVDLIILKADKCIGIVFVVDVFTYFHVSTDRKLISRSACSYTNLTISCNDKLTSNGNV